MKPIWIFIKLILVKLMLFNSQIMRSTVLYFLILFCYSFLLAGCDSSKDRIEPEPEPVEEATTVKVMTYNIWGARSGGIPGLQGLADVIKKADPDLVALQEVDKFTSRNSQNGDIAKELAELTDMEYYFVKAINVSGGEYGDAILSKLPIKETKGYRLTTTAELGGELRSVARITVERDGKEFYFISTHLDHLSNEANRIHQAKELNAIITDLDKPVILGGDLNARPDSETIGLLKQQLTMGCTNCQFTFPTSGANRTIDYLMYAPLNAIKVLNYQVFDYASKESDHFPVVATFEIK